MNVSISYKGYIHTHYESYKNVEFISIGNGNIKLKVNAATLIFELKKIVDLKVTQ